MSSEAKTEWSKLKLQPFPFAPDRKKKQQHIFWYLIIYFLAYGMNFFLLSHFNVTEINKDWHNKGNHEEINC